MALPVSLVKVGVVGVAPSGTPSLAVLHLREEAAVAPAEREDVEAREAEAASKAAPASPSLFEVRHSGLLVFTRLRQMAATVGEAANLSRAEKAAWQAPAVQPSAVREEFTRDAPVAMAVTVALGVTVREDAEATRSRSPKWECPTWSSAKTAESIEVTRAMVAKEATRPHRSSTAVMGSSARISSMTPDARAEARNATTSEPLAQHETLPSLRERSERIGRGRARVARPGGGHSNMLVGVASGQNAKGMLRRRSFSEDRR